MRFDQATRIVVSNISQLDLAKLLQLPRIAEKSASNVRAIIARFDADPFACDGLREAGTKLAKAETLGVRIHDEAALCELLGSGGSR